MSTIMSPFGSTHGLAPTNSQIAQMRLGSCNNISVSWLYILFCHKFFFFFTLPSSPLSFLLISILMTGSCYFSVIIILLSFIFYINVFCTLKADCERNQVQFSQLRTIIYPLQILPLLKYLLFVKLTSLEILSQ